MFNGPDFRYIIEYYVSHGGGKLGNFTDKLEEAKRRGVWFLRKDWEEVSNRSTATGVSWLQEMSSWLQEILVEDAKINKEVSLSL